MSSQGVKILLRELLSGNMEPIDILVYILAAATVILITLPIHEFAHGFAAVKLGDNTPRYQGRLSLNPLAHLDLVGSLCILAFGFGWAKPVQVNHFNFRNPKRDMAIVAFAGPFANILLALFSLLLYNLVLLIYATVAPLAALVYVMAFFYWIASINVGLAVFNLIPIPPFDGSRIMTAFLPNRTYYKLMQYERYIFWIVLILLWTGILDLPIDFLSGKVMLLLEWIADLPFKAFL